MKYLKTRNLLGLLFVFVSVFGSMFFYVGKNNSVKAGPPCTINTFTATPSTVTIGSASDIHWVTSNCQLVSITNIGSGLPDSGTQSTGALSGTTSYVLSAVGGGQFLYATVKVTVTLACMNISTDGPYPHAWMSVNASSDAQKLIAGGDDNLDNTPIPKQVTYSTNGGTGWGASGTYDQWYSVATSDDGMMLMAGGFGNVYTSNNGGSSWTAHTDFGVHGWTAAAISQDGTKQYVGSSTGQFYRSLDSGSTWSPVTIYGGGHNWTSIAISNDGTSVALAGNDSTTGYIYTSTDSGATWTKQSGSANHHWRSVASGSSGNKLIAVADTNTGDYPFISTDSGVTWTQQTNAGSHKWSSAASSSNGSRLAVADGAGYVYTSTDSGGTWTAQTCAGSHNWTALDMSSSGTKMIGSSGAWDAFDYIYKNF